MITAKEAKEIMKSKRPDLLTSALSAVNDAILARANKGARHLRFDTMACGLEDFREDIIDHLKAEGFDVSSSNITKYALHIEWDKV